MNLNLDTAAPASVGPVGGDGLRARRLSGHPQTADAEARSRPRVIGAILAVGLCVGIGLVVTLPRKPAPGPGTQAESMTAEPSTAALPLNSPVSSPAASASMEDRWGIRITSMRLTAGGSGLDMRYLVVDPAKATGLLRLTEETFILDEASGKTLSLPFQRENQTTQKLVAGKTYFALLANKGQVVKPGGKVSVIVGHSRTDNLVVE